jgi:tRNA(Met) C34 N-acetyltransferase TmcA
LPLNLEAGRTYVFAAAGSGITPVISMLRALAEHAPAVRAAVKGLGLDLIGASFGATPELLAFWDHCGLPPAHLGTSRNAASGAHAAVVLAGLSPAGEALAERARGRLGERLPALLAGPFRDLDPGTYTLKAAGPVRNRSYTSEATTAVVTPPPAPAPNVTLELK